MVKRRNIAIISEIAVLHTWAIAHVITPVLAQYDGQHLTTSRIDLWTIHLRAFFRIEGHVALDMNPGPVHNTLLLLLIRGELSSEDPYSRYFKGQGIIK